MNCIHSKIAIIKLFLQLEGDFDILDFLSSEITWPSLQDTNGIQKVKWDQE